MCVFSKSREGQGNFSFTFVVQCDCDLLHSTISIIFFRLDVNVMWHSAVYIFSLSCTVTLNLLNVFSVAFRGHSSLSVKMTTLVKLSLFLKT